MLILTRRLREEIVIDTSDGPVTVSVSAISPEGGSVKLAFTAPPTVRITRAELERDYPGNNDAPPEAAK